MDCSGLKNVFHDTSQWYMQSGALEIKLWTHAWLAQFGRAYDSQSCEGPTPSSGCFLLVEAPDHPHVLKEMALMSEAQK